jgi:hypothetical protein
MERTSFDNQIFKWEAWEEMDGELSLQFFDIELNVPVGQFPVGTKFPLALLMGDISILTLVDDQRNEYHFDLKLTVGEAVDPNDYQAECGEGCTHH